MHCVGSGTRRWYVGWACIPVCFLSVLPHTPVVLGILEYDLSFVLYLFLNLSWTFWYFWALDWYCPSPLSPLRPNLRSSLTAVESAAFLLLSLSLNSLPTQCPPPAPVLMWELGKLCFVVLYTSATFHALQTSTLEESQNVQPFLIKQLLHQWSHYSLRLFSEAGRSWVAETRSVGCSQKWRCTKLLCSS